jgi:hypothetical protein
LQRQSQDSTERFQRILAEIAAEPPEARSRRWRGEFDRQAGANETPLVLFGSGQFGQWVLGRLRRARVVRRHLPTEVAGDCHDRLLGGEIGNNLHRPVPGVAMPSCGC